MVYKFQPLQNCLWHLKILCSLLCMPIFWMLLEEVKRYKFPMLIVLTHRWKWTLRLLPHTIFLIVPAMSKIICPFILTTLTQSPQPNKLTICKINMILIHRLMKLFFICSVFISYLLFSLAICLLRSQMPVQLICSSQVAFSSLQNIGSPYLLKSATFCEPEINKDIRNQFYKLTSEG